MPSAWRKASPAVVFGRIGLDKPVPLPPQVFLGFGVPTSSISWGVMINEVMVELVLGKWWQLATVAIVMSTFVVAFGLFTDLLRDALDPKANRR